MPGRDGQLVIARDRAQHRYPDRFAGLPQHLFVPRRPDLVEDHPADPHGALQRRKAVQQSRNALTLATRIDHQQHRRAQQSGDLGGGSAGRGQELFVDATVEQSHDALDDGDVGIPRTVPVQRPDQILAHHDRVEVAARPAGGQRVVTRIDEVRTDLERCDAVAHLAQRGHQTGCNGGLSAAR